MSEVVGKLSESCRKVVGKLPALGLSTVYSLHLHPKQGKNRQSVDKRRHYAKRRAIASAVARVVFA